MANFRDLSAIPGTNLNESDLLSLEDALGAHIPADLRDFLGTYGYASFIDQGYGEITIGDQNAAFGQFYGKRPSASFNPHDFDSGALRVGDVRSHYPRGSLIFAGDELGGEYFLKILGDNPGIYWMIYDSNSDSRFVCESFSDFLSRIVIRSYDD